jgi:hypothetical protein
MRGEHCFDAQPSANCRHGSRQSRPIWERDMISVRTIAFMACGIASLAAPAFADTRDDVLAGVAR